MKKVKGGAKRTGVSVEKPYEEAELISALNHPLRREILRLIHSSRGPLSPTLIEEKLGLSDKLSNVAYHVTVLSGYNAIALASQRQVRGALEHFYASQVSDVAWLRGLLSRTQEADEAALRPTRQHR